jgi:hypothetical protein
MSPPYQRQGAIWTPKDKSFLVDSILNEYDLPKIYIADFTFANTLLNRQKLQYAVIDGKQRLEAIFDFYEGNILLDKKFVYEEDPSVKLGGLGYSDLEHSYPEIALRFDNFNLSAMSVITDDEAKINELFVRLNRSRPLTGAEIRNAMQGPVPELIRRLATHRFFTLKVRFSTNRGQDRNVAAKLLLLEFRGRFVDVKKTPLDRFVQEAVSAEAQVTDFELAASRVEDVLDDMTQVFVNRDPLLSSQGPVPVYYWLCRNLDEHDRTRLREFLVNFNKARQENRALARDPDNAERVDTELVRYDNLDRSTNDQGSLEGRYEILRNRFARFQKDARELASRSA